MYVEFSTDCGCNCGCGYTFPPTSHNEYFVAPLVSTASTLKKFEKFSIEMWIRIESLSGNKIIVHNRPNAAFDTRHWGVAQMGNELFVFNTFSTLTTPTLGDMIGVRIPISTGWNHLIVSFEGSRTQFWKVFLNGRELNSAERPPINIAPPHVHNPPVILNEIRFGGSYPLFGMQNFDGSIAQFRLYLKDTNYEEANYNYTNGYHKPRNQEYLAIWAPFQNCFGYGAPLLGMYYVSNAILFNYDYTRTFAPPYPAWSHPCPEKISEICRDIEDNACSPAEDPIVLSTCDKLQYPAWTGENITLLQRKLYLTLDCAWTDISAKSPSISPAPILSMVSPDLSHGRAILHVKIPPAGTTIYIANRQYNCATPTGPVSYNTIIMGSGTGANVNFINTLLTSVLNSFLGGNAVSVFYPKDNEAIIEYINNTPGCSVSMSNELLLLSNKEANTFTKLQAFVNETNFPPNYNIFPDACFIQSECFTGRVVWTNLCISMIMTNYCEYHPNDYQLDATCSPPAPLPIDGNCQLLRNNKLRFALANINLPPFPNTVAYCTQPIKWVSKCDSFIVRFGNHWERLKTVRVEGTVRMIGVSKKQEVSYSPKGINRKLYSAVSNEYEIETALYSEKWHSLFARALEKDIVEIENNGQTIRVICEDNYNIDWNKEAFNNRKGKARIKVKSVDRECANSF